MHRERSSVGWWIGGLIVIAVAVALGVYFGANRPRPSEVPATATTTPPPAPATPVVQHPISEAANGTPQAPPEPLPALADSDSTVADALSTLAGGRDLADILIARAIIPRIVATIDALPSRKLGTNILPVRGAPGKFQVERRGGGDVIAASNSDRYAEYLRIVEAVDPAAAVAWYVRFYPLFQQAYRDLGYPNGYFNDRLIAVIDHLLAAPDPSGPVAIRKTETTFAYADPALESLSAGQKMLVRIGPDDEATVKTKLRAIRAALVGSKVSAPG